MKKTRVTTSSSNPDLPLDLWLDILSKLPVKSLLRFRFVSMSWRSLIDDPNFCRLHLNNFKSNLNETHLFVIQKLVKERKKNCFVRSYSTFKITTSVASLDTPNLGEKWGVICSLDGLVMIQCFAPTHELMLWNPSIRRARILPPSPIISTGLWNVDLGFGFDPLIKDYKHVRLVRCIFKDLPLISVYTVGTGLWKTIEFQGKGISDWHWTFNYYTRWKASCCRGTLYFIARNYTLNVEELVSFDLSNGVFASTCLPDVDDTISDKFAQKALTLEDGGCLLGVVYLWVTKGCMWVLESSGVWTKQYTFLSRVHNLYRGEHPKPKLLHLKKNQEMMLQWSTMRVTSHNLESGDESDLVKTPGRLNMKMVCGYIESLVLLNG